MSHPLTYSFAADDGLTLAPRYIDADGAVGDAVEAGSSFSMAGWYGFTLLVEDGYRGFIGFFDGGAPVAMFAVNPEEGENLDARVSGLDARGPGGVTHVAHARDTSGNPIEGASVWVTSDAAGDALVAGTLISGSSGTATFLLAPGVYYLWRRHGRYAFQNPKRIEVA